MVNSEFLIFIIDHLFLITISNHALLSFAEWNALANEEYFQSY